MQTMYRFLSENCWIRVTGPDAQRFLQGMLTADMDALRLGEGCPAVLLTAKGKMVADFVVYRTETGFLLSCVQQAKQSALEMLQRHLIMDDATVEDASDAWATLGVYGVGTPGLLATTLGVGDEALPRRLYEHRMVSGEVWVAVACDLGIAGFHVMGPWPVLEGWRAQWEQRGVLPMPGALAQQLRVEAGIPLYGVDMDQERLPLEARLDAAVSFSKGCYVGQEVMVRVTSRGHINRKLMGLSFPAGGFPPAVGTPLVHPTKENAGTVMSGTVSDRFGTIALGYVHRSLWEPGTTLYVASPGDPFSTSLPMAVVRALPFA